MDVTNEAIKSVRLKPLPSSSSTSAVVVSDAKWDEWRVLGQMVQRNMEKVLRSFNDELSRMAHRVVDSDHKVEGLPEYHRIYSLRVDAPQPTLEDTSSSSSSLSNTCSGFSAEDE